MESIIAAVQPFVGPVLIIGLMFLMHGRPGGHGAHGGHGSNSRTATREEGPQDPTNARGSAPADGETAGRDRVAPAAGGHQHG